MWAAAAVVVAVADVFVGGGSGMGRRCRAKTCFVVDCTLSFERGLLHAFVYLPEKNRGISSYDNEIIGWQSIVAMPLLFVASRHRLIGEV